MLISDVPERLNTKRVEGKIQSSFFFFFFSLFSLAIFSCDEKTRWTKKGAGPFNVSTFLLPR